MPTRQGPTPSTIEKLLVGCGVAVFCAGGFALLARQSALRAAEGVAHLSLATPLDGLVPLSPGWVWIYLSYYPASLLAFLAWRRGVLFRQVAAGYVLEAAICMTAFALVPARMEQPPVAGGGLAESALRALYAIDSGFNIFPSLHVANAVLLAALATRIEKGFGGLVWAWAALVAFSTVAVKQHYAVDVPAGAIVGLGVSWLVLCHWDGLTPGERRARSGSLEAARAGSARALKNPRPLREAAGCTEHAR